jgi:hypothetical protein
MSGSGINMESGDLMRATLSYNGTVLTEIVTDTVTGATYASSYTANIPSLVGRGRHRHPEPVELDLHSGITGAGCRPDVLSCRWNVFRIAEYHTVKRVIQEQSFVTTQPEVRQPTAQLVGPPEHCIRAP